jgi:hypothetical protein
MFLNGLPRKTSGEVQCACHMSIAESQVGIDTEVEMVMSIPRSRSFKVCDTCRVELVQSEVTFTNRGCMVI